MMHVRFGTCSLERQGQHFRLMTKPTLELPDFIRHVPRRIVLTKKLRGARVLGNPLETVRIAVTI